MKSGVPVLGWDEAKAAADSMRRLRKEQELTQADLGARLGVSQAWVSVRERGAVRIRRAAAEKIAAALGTDLAGLAGGAP